MKKFVMIAALIACVQPAFAADHVQDMRGDGDAVAGAIIGGVIGGIIGGAIGGNQGPRHGGHHGPMPRPMPRPFPGDQQVLCYARNARGEVFRAFGWGERRTQEMAMDKCERVSRFCRPIGCQR